ncbi:phenylacetate--CoA ligase family protein [Rhodococcus sp. IEGM1428]|uniref:phenylacetate--CoA ligase family protein n=1 Tax=Rhodococcus sp. IEGM1428 TaxID=3392191 RepID=UPI003D0DDFF9
MSIGIRRPFESVDYSAVAQLFPPPPEYFETRWFEEPEVIDARKISRLRDRAERAYRIPFHRNRWQKAGVEPADLRTLADIDKFPLFDVDDIRLSIEGHPPLGDYQGMAVEDALREPLRIHMSGGTTGQPRPTLYTAWDREVGAVLTARGLYMMGLRPGDTVLNSWSYGLHNGAFNFDEAVSRWLNGLVITTSTGNVTSTRKQVELACAYNAAAILTTGPYLLRLAEEAKAMGVELPIRALAMNVGSEDELEQTFDLPAYRSYGFHEVQAVSVECPARRGLHVFEDAYHAQIVDCDTGEPVADGQPGALVLTEFYKTGSAQFRYNTQDLTFLYPRERCACGSWQRRMGFFAGRGDNMVKLRGVNVWPEGVGLIAASAPGATSDYFVTARRIDDRDELIAEIVSENPRQEWEGIRMDIEQRLKDKLGVHIAAEVVAPGALDVRTGIATAPKPKRFQDDR